MGEKRKEREDEHPLPPPSNAAQQIKGSTLFVSNLPYTATSVDLQTLFSDIAPVRSAFVVLDKETRKSKGVGYVSFAIKEDAALAVAQIEQQGILLDKRNLRVQFADSKPHDTEEGSPGPKPKKPRQPRQSLPRAGPTDPLAIRTIVISGLPASIDSKSLWKKVRKLEGADKISQWPGKTLSDQEDPTTAQVLFSTPATAQDAVLRLHAHVFKGSLLSVVFKKRLDTLAKSSGNPSRASRLIVRNLPWNTVEHDLRRLFLPYGPIHSITIPVGKPEEEGGRPRAKGFAFVWMMSKKDAETAVEGANGATMGGNADEDPHGNGKERVIAVDWALSKERWEEEKGKTVEDVGEGIDAGFGGMSQDDDESGDENVGVHEDSESEGEEESGSDDNDNDDGENDDAPDRPLLPPPETGNTLFIRNVPFTATEDELRTLFRSFGPLRYARITLDAATGRSRGTGFVCFWNKEDADRAIQQAELLTSETGSTQVAAKKNPFKLTSILTPDPSSSLARSLVMQGRTLDVTRAVTREEAGRLRELGEKQREKQDKRNLYLMREGVIFADTPAASTLSAAELEKRVQAFNTRRTLMRSNPSLYVSKTRISVRQLPTFVTERTLKRLAMHAVRTFEEEVKSGVREGLTADELREIEGDGAAELDGELSSKKRKRKRGERQTAVRQAKIVRISDRIDPITGKGRSKGYGFLEMMSHADALRVIRWANNHPGVEGLMRGWWREELQDIEKKAHGKKMNEEEETRVRRVKDRLRELEEDQEKKVGRSLVLEFSIENIQVVRRRVEREEGSRQESQSKQREEKLLPTKKRRVPSSGESDNARPTKKARTTIVKEVKSGEATVNHLGGLIGRKRKETKSKGKAR
ncbi:hypothetical protein JB92DRAFT_3234511 [Gautieria morchelliformis]|nr:hypothetical protein JB92DRAFT_3234511 [Gautieria morchelliformis]